MFHRFHNEIFMAFEKEQVPFQKLLTKSRESQGISELYEARSPSSVAVAVCFLGRLIV